MKVRAAILNLNGFDLLLGNDTLSQLGAIKISYDSGTGKGFMTGKDLNVIEPTYPNNAVINLEDRTIPSFSSVSVPIQIPNRVKGTTSYFMMEPSSDIFLKKGLTLGRLLLPDSPCENTSHLLLTNFSNTEQWVGKGAVLEKMEDMDTIEVVDEIFDETKWEDLNFDGVISSELNDECRAVALELLNRYSDCFANSSTELGKSNIVQHKIETTTSIPIHQPPYPSAWKARETIQQQVQELLQAGVIEPSSSPWSFPVVLIRKKMVVGAFASITANLTKLPSKMFILCPVLMMH